MVKNFNWWTRKLHRWGALLFALPLLLVIVTGLLLQVKKQVPWVQPPTQPGSQANQLPQIHWEQMLEVAQQVPQAEIGQWADIARVDVQPKKGMAKIQAKNGWELQVDLADGDLLSSTFRRSDVIESLHDGSFFADAAKLWIFLPNGLALLALWCTGVWLWYLPLRAKQKQSRKKRARGSLQREP